MRDVARGRHWAGHLRIGDTDWQVRAIPTAGGPLETSYDRAGAVLIVGMLLTLSLSTYLMLASRNSRRLSLANRRVLELAQTDVLTGLPNRAFFLARLDELNGQLRDRGPTFSILMLDLDRFKNVNDSLGHGAGDALLRLVAQRLKSAVRATDVLARLGGDEFAIIQEGCEDQRACSTELAARIAKLVAEPFLLPGHRVEIGTSIGIAIAPDHGSDQEQLLKKADLALYRSKSAGRNCFTIYDEAMSAELEARNTLEGDLRDAIARCQLEVHYQPFMDATTGARRGFEALVRWRHPARGLIPPDQFIRARRGDRADRAARRIRAASRLRGRGKLAVRSDGRGQPVADPVQGSRSVRRHLRGACGIPACRRSGSRSRSPNPCCWSAAPRTTPSWSGSSTSASSSRSTISAPAIPR